MINNTDSIAALGQFDQATFPQLVALQQQQFNSQLQDSDFEEGFGKQQSTHRIHRSLSDSKYGQNEPTQRMGRLLNSDSQNSAVVSPMNSFGVLTEQNQLTLAGTAQSKIGNSDPYVNNRGSSWTHSLVSFEWFWEFVSGESWIVIKKSSNIEWRKIKTDSGSLSEFEGLRSPDADCVVERWGPFVSSGLSSPTRAHSFGEENSTPLNCPALCFGGQLPLLDESKPVQAQNNIPIRKLQP